jgi:hypothetical protein
MKKLLIALALVAGVLSAQTEVRQAIALPSYKDLKYASSAEDSRSGHFHSAKRHESVSTGRSRVTRH